MTTSLINRYRPAALDQVLGHDAVIRNLEDNLKRESSHCFLLSSTVPGTGKTTLSRIMAERLGCKAPMGIYEVDGATKNGIDDMRELQELLKFKPLNGGNLGIIVDECHAITAQAWKALLKSVEEPPSWVYWFFCTTELGKVPVAIASRCTKQELKPLKVGLLTELLDFIVEEEKMKVVKGITAFCAEEAQGSARNAITNLEACAAAESLAEAAGLLASATLHPAAIDLCRALLAGTNWKEASALIAAMEDVNAESIRMVIVNYMSKVALGAKTEKTAVQAITIMDHFAQPFYAPEKMAPLIRTVGLLVLDK